MSDSWTFFGSYSRAEVIEAESLLRATALRFEVKEEKEFVSGNGWSGPFALWIRDEDAAEASHILVPHFARRERKEAIQPSETTRGK